MNLYRVILSEGDNMARIYMVRSLGGDLIPLFLKNKVVALGWDALGNLTGKNRNQIKELVIKTYPNEKAVYQWSGIVDTFVNIIQKGDYVVTYDKYKRLYYVGEVLGDYFYDDKIDKESPNFRKVNWNKRVISRDELSNAAKNSLGGVATVFHISQEAESEIFDILNNKESTKNEQELADNVELQSEELIENSTETLKDKILGLSPDNMEELVKEILYAMGYIARRTPKGSDRSIDVFASKDGLGLEEPRIFAEVKHRKGAMGAPEIRTFIGGRQVGDRCIYVSTGGFTKEAKYEAERSKVAIFLVDLDALVELVITHYDKFRVEGKVLLPLRKVYLPA